MRGLRRIDVITFAPPELELLRSVSLLSLLPEPTLESLARALVRVEAAAGEVFIREGDPGELFYVIETGTVMSQSTANASQPSDRGTTSARSRSSATYRARQP